MNEQNRFQMEAAGKAGNPQATTAAPDTTPKAGVEDKKQDATQSSTQQAQKSSKAKTQSKAEIICEFLRGCRKHEADAIRVMIDVAERGGDFSKMPDADKAILNDYLSDEFNKGMGGESQFQQHRIGRANELLRKVTDIIDREMFVSVSTALTLISAGMETVHRSYEKLPAAVAR